MQIHEDPRPEKALELLARLGADPLDHLTTPPDDDRLLGLMLDHDRAVQPEDALFTRFLELVDHDRRREGDLGARVAEQLLTHDLGSEDALRLIGQVVLRVERRSPLRGSPESFVRGDRHRRR